MAVTLEIPNEYGYVLLTVVSTAFVNLWHGMQTSAARKTSGIGYPNAYATPEQAEKNPEAYRLNCAQRAHANFTENLVPFLPTLLIAGLRYPVPAAAAGAGWLVSRIVYTKGYTSNAGPKGRMAGSLAGYLCYLPLIGMAGYTAFQISQGN
ncbi:hypothetical protein M406DRAFT_358559 [Cryphonectria parasitica EP155]|uniref:Microsomal glutathione S-transferase 3 n=1 Tax=Cryphonectria parasitica (strain ATCC 38755 / EP155) TaxID=660469 RepID=A0A9P4XSM8_CRYP1|nr:uncharacterized protein M406DRAFT_358559 [Cryphonectria parasitica EP155]KAF3760229.1 hypothetical protein M406DRAFT_358559 [Cryphonectria parasitica EP155]